VPPLVAKPLVQRRDRWHLVRVLAAEVARNPADARQDQAAASARLAWTKVWARLLGDRWCHYGEGAAAYRLVAACFGALVQHVWIAPRC
jgi:hypothetical protein